MIREGKLCQNKQDGNHLAYRFRFSHPTRAHYFIRKHTRASHSELSCNNDERHPMLDTLSYQKNQSRSYKKLVCQRVKHCASVRLLITPPCNPAIKHI